MHERRSRAQAAGGEFYVTGVVRQVPVDQKYPPAPAPRAAAAAGLTPPAPLRGALGLQEADDEGVPAVHFEAFQCSQQARAAAPRRGPRAQLPPQPGPGGGPRTGGGPLERTALRLPPLPATAAWRARSA